MSDNEVTFTIHATMRKRWVPHFTSMLQHMQYLGIIGSSRKVTFYSDGDGDFRPKFEFSGITLEEVEPRSEELNGNRFYDAG